MGTATCTSKNNDHASSGRSRKEWKQKFGLMPKSQPQDIQKN
jgi:hypothetical protein